MWYWLILGDKSMHRIFNISKDTHVSEINVVVDTKTSVLFLLRFPVIKI